MGKDFCICKALFGQSAKELYTPLIVAAIAQFFFGFLWYGILMRNPYCRAVATDKGVKAVAFIKQIYATPVAVFTSLITGIFRAAAIVSIVHHAASYQADAKSSLCIYSQAATAVWLVAQLPSLEDAFYAQRPLTLIVLSAGFNLGCALIASLVLFFGANNKLF